MRRHWITKSNGILLNYVPIVFDPLFSKLFKSDEIFTNRDGTEYSCKKIWVYRPNGETEEFNNYSEGIKSKFPGYELDSNYVVKNVSDQTFDLQKHCELLLSKYNDKIYKDAIENDTFGRT